MTVAESAPKMKSRIWLLRLLKIVLVVGIVWLLGWYFIFRGPIAHSDVPVTADVGWWPYQDKLEVTDFTAESVDPHLNLFAHEFVVRFHIVGKIHTIDAEGWRPTIASAQITGRVKLQGYYKLTETNHVTSIADVLVIPIVSQISDKSYKGEDISFDVKLEQVFSTMGWGNNHYECRCGDKIATVDVVQGK